MIRMEAIKDDEVMMDVLRKYVPNYHINLLNPYDVDDISIFKTDLQMFIGMIKCNKDKNKMRNYIFQHEEYFSNLDYESGIVYDQVLNVGKLIKKDFNEEGESVDLCKAIQDMYDSAKEEGVQQGLEQGLEQGLDRMSQLVTILIDSGRSDDLKKASLDADYREKLFVEYNV